MKITYELLLELELFLNGTETQFRHDASYFLLSCSSSAVWDDKLTGELCMKSINSVTRVINPKLKNELPNARCFSFSQWLLNKITVYAAGAICLHIF